MSAMRDLPDTVVVESLRQDGEFVISRAKREAGLPPWLLVSAVSERPAPEILAQLQQAYTLRDELESSWATRSLELVQHKGRAIVAWHEVPGTAPPQKSGPVGYGVIRASVRGQFDDWRDEFRRAIPLGCGPIIPALRATLADISQQHLAKLEPFGVWFGAVKPKSEQ